MNESNRPDATSDTTPSAATPLHSGPGTPLIDSVVRRPPVALPIAIVAILAAAVAFGIRSAGSDDLTEPADLPEAAVEPTPSAEPSPDPPLSAPANLSAHLGSGELPALSGGRQTDRLDDPLTMVVLRLGRLAAFDLQTGEQTTLPSPGSITGQSLAALDQAVVVTADSHALAVSLNRQAPHVLGQADRVLDSALPNTVWVGRSAARDDGTPIVTWTEVSGDGAVGRIAEREQPMEFDQPDFVWGFNSSLYRLGRRDVHPWRLIAHGFPVAVGTNDVVVNICSAERSCDRVWYDLQSGERLSSPGRVEAEAIPWRYGGQISPAGSFVAIDGELPATQIWSIADGALMPTECSDNDLAWAPGDSHVACRSDLGLIVVDTSTRNWIVVDSVVDGVDNFILVPTP